MKITVPIDAIPQKSPSHRRDTGNVYKPDVIRKYQADVAMIARSQIRDHEIFTGAVRVELKIFRKKKSAIIKGYGDADNLAKPILDALTMTGAVWHDDCQVTDLRVIKETAPEPHIEITIEEC